APTPSFRATFTFKTGYSRKVVDRLLFQKVTDAGQPFDIALVPEADTNARLVFLTADFVRFSGRHSIEPGLPDVKWVVGDLDNTIWEGILLERDDVTLKSSILEIIRTLDQRGILMSIASKNNHDDTWPRLEQLGIADYFLYPQITWMPKSRSLQ